MATVQNFENITSVSDMQNIISFLRNNWTWAAEEDAPNPDNPSYTYNGKIFYLDAAKTKGVNIHVRNGTNSVNINPYFKGNHYHYATNNPNVTSTYPFSMKIEITSDTLIISWKYESATVPVANCEKMVVHNAVNPNTNATEQVLTYIGNKSSSNVSAMYASDVITPADNSEQNGNANVNGKYTALINLYNTKSNFVATNVYKSMFMELSAWSFGDVMLNGHRYRMSGPIFALDE